MSAWSALSALALISGQFLTWSWMDDSGAPFRFYCFHSNDIEYPIIGHDDDIQQTTWWISQCILWPEMTLDVSFIF